VIIPPSIVISDLDQIIKDETYEVMIRQISTQPFQNTLVGDKIGGIINQAQIGNMLEETHASFQARVGNVQQAIG
jgi:peptide methionine sulfoxide reductase MsrB